MLYSKFFHFCFILILLSVLTLLVSSCRTFSIPETYFTDIADDISIISRPDFDPESILPFSFEAGDPGLEPPESVVTCIRLKTPEQVKEDEFIPVSPEVIDKPVAGKKKKSETGEKQEIKLDKKKEIRKYLKKSDEKLKTTTSVVNGSGKKTEVKTMKKNDTAAKIASAKIAGEKNTDKKTAVKEKKSEPRVSEIYSHKGEDIEISFNNNGWIFAGYGREEDAKGIRYVSKDSSYASSCFTFKTLKSGSFDLEFLLQDHSSGAEQKELVRVFVLEGNSSLPSDSISGCNGNDQTGKSAAEAWIARGNYEKALEEYLKAYDNESWQDNENIADMYERLGRDELAAAFWGKNLNADESAPVLKSAKRLLDISAKNNDCAKINYYLDFLLGKGHSPSVDEILSIAESLNKKGAMEDVLAFVNKYTPLCTDQDSMDKIYFFLGRIHETDSVIRDLKKSKFYYEKILSEYPASALCRQSEARLGYLDRHFFRIH